MVFIYGLTDPDTGAIRYIGKANNMGARLKSHLRDATTKSRPVNLWIRALVVSGKLPGMIELRRVADVDWPRAEKELIAAHSDLLNLASGGKEPFCPRAVCAENGRRNALARVRDPRAARLWALRRGLGHLLRDGAVSAATKAKMRARPDLFGQFAGYL